MGVSHPSLEQVRNITRQHGLRTKLTGAGGGGCAVTILRDGEYAVVLVPVSYSFTFPFLTLMFPQIPHKKRLMPLSQI
jgi:galactokinase